MAAPAVEQARRRLALLDAEIDKARGVLTRAETLLGQLSERAQHRASRRQAQDKALIEKYTSLRGGA